MAKKAAPSQLVRAIGGIAACVLAAASLQAVASTGIKPECPTQCLAAEPIELPPPSLRFQKTELGGSKPLPITSSEIPDKESSAALTSTDVIDELLRKDDSDELPDPAANRPVELPPTATRLPGVEEDQLPRFKRQMFRTDI